MRLTLCAESCCGVELLCWVWDIYSVLRGIYWCPWMVYWGCYVCWFTTQLCASVTLFLLLTSSVIGYVYSLRERVNNVLSIGTAHVKDTTERSVSHASGRTCFEHWALIGELYAVFLQYYFSPASYKNYIRWRLVGSHPKLSWEFAADRICKEMRESNITTTFTQTPVSVTLQG
jgi:hypothetical protein